MLKNLELTGGLVFSGQLLLELAAAGMSREDAYRLVQSNAMRAWSSVDTGEELSFKTLIAQDPEITSRLSPQQIADAFDYHRQLENIDKIFARVTAEA